MTSNSGTTGLLTAKQVAGKLNVSYRKVLDLIATGDIEAYRIGGGWRINPSAISFYLTQVKKDRVEHI